MLFRADLCRPTAPFKLNLPLNDGSGTTAADISGNGLNGTLSGGTWIAAGTGLVKAITKTITKAATATAGMIKTSLKVLFANAIGAPVRQNLMPNPSFEASATGWGEYHNGSGVNTILALDATTAQVGSQSLKLTTAATGNSFAGTSAGLNGMLIGATYTFSIYAKGQAGGENLNFYWSDGNNQVNFTLTTSWVRYTFTFVANATGQSVYARSSTPGAVFWIDAAQLEPGIAPTAYLDGSQTGGIWLGTANNSVSQQVMAKQLLANRMLTYAAAGTVALIKAITKTITRASTATVTILEQRQLSRTLAYAAAGSVSIALYRKLFRTVSYAGTALPVLSTMALHNLILSAAGTSLAAVMLRGTKVTVGRFVSMLYSRRPDNDLYQ